MSEIRRNTKSLCPGCRHSVATSCQQSCVLDDDLRVGLVLGLHRKLAIEEGSVALRLL